MWFLAGYVAGILTMFAARFLGQFIHYDDDD